MNTMAKARQGKVIRELYDNYGGHEFLSREGVLHFTEPFGFQGYTYKAKANPQDFKGLSLQDKDGTPIDELDGNGSMEVALQIAKHLNLTVPDMHGRGSQFHVAVAKILEHVSPKE